MRECVNEKKTASTHIRIDALTLSATLREMRKILINNNIKNKKMFDKKIFLI